MTTTEELGFDPDELRARYEAERDKRLRPDGAEQYIELTGRFAHYYEEDPYVDAPIERAPINAEANVVVIGGGFSGLLAGARLTEIGIDEFNIIEAGADFGGTWYWNRYPGAQCDIESYCYLPLLEELEYMPKEKYSFAPEIYEHSRRIGKHYGLYDKTWFQTRVRSVDWDESIKRWHLRTNRGDDIRARFVIFALGPANRPKLPGIEGIDDFKGHSFHTARWDYDYTGGDTNGGMTGLADKRVAIIGTGATAIQCVPRTAECAQHLYVFQRTPSSVDLRGNKPTDPDWWKSLSPGWQKARRENFAGILAGEQFDEDLVNDGWTDIFRNMTSELSGGGSILDIGKAVELADFRKMNSIRRRVEETVNDPATAEALKPYYRQMCKRPTFNDEYLPAFNRDNVTLVDVSESKGIGRITEKGVVANGVEYAVDCIIFASGFEITTKLERRIGLPVNGRDGLSLFEHWGGGIKSLHGFTTRGFPNWFYIGMSQNAFSVNMTQMFDEQAQHIAYLIKETIDRGATTIEPSEEGQRAWCELIDNFGAMTAALGFFESCTPGYYNNEGQGQGGLSSGVYAAGINAFNQLLVDWRERGDLDGMELDR
ncbi:MAG TPA: NAD(P)/FAD-dependent oxidoreductase [Acidimicrobiales bacterium]|nr:NAD(P)/FAD-dependent oxidoreductase [Acidimicrobiales bacterium]